MQQERLKGSLARGVTKTREQLDVIREAWEGKLQAIFDGTPGRKGNSLQALPKDAAATVKATAAGFGSMEDCFGDMQEHYASLVRSAKAQRESSLAAVCYILVKLVSCRFLSCHYMQSW